MLVFFQKSPAKKKIDGSYFLSNRQYRIMAFSDYATLYNPVNHFYIFYFILFSSK